MTLRVLPLAITAAAVLALSCGDDDSTGTTDSTPPAAVTDLAVTAVGETSVTLSWTAPGDDGTTGTATAYDIRYALSEITDADWDAATVVEGEPDPAVAGATQTMEVPLPARQSRTTVEASGSAVGDVYYFAIKTVDEADNWSTLSNVPNTESADLVAPAAITDLAVAAVTATSVTLSWTATGDDDATGTAASYDIRYSTSAINDANWDLVTSIDGEPPPQPAGTAENMEVTVIVAESGIASGTAAPAAGNTYYFAIKAIDEANNWSALSNVVSGELADGVAPAAITDLAITSVTTSTMTLTWTATGDDDATGTAATYDIRYATSTIDDGNWDLATSIDGEPVPQTAGTAESMEVTISGGVGDKTALSTAGETYYLAIKAGDEADNWSSLSNVVSGELVEPLIPAAVVDLACTDSIGEAMTLTWTAPGNDGNTGTAAAYALRYATDPITEGTWDAATPVSGLAAPQAAGSAETFVFEDVTWWQTYHWALKAQSDTDNWSDISNIPRGTPLPPAEWKLLLRTRDGILSYSFNGNTAVFTTGNYPVETSGDRAFVGRWRSGIYEYNASGTELAITPIPEGIWYGDFTPIPGDRFALTENGSDSIWVIDTDGDLLAEDVLIAVTNTSNQSLDGVVVGNTLIVCEDGQNKLIQMDCDSYAVSVFRDFSALGSYLSRIEYYRDQYYLTQAHELYSFTATGEPTLLYTFSADGSALTGLAVAGGHAFVCRNSAGTLYRVDLKTGVPVLLTDGLNYPQDLALLRD